MAQKKSDLQHLSLEGKRELANLLDMEAYMLERQVVNASKGDVLDWRIAERKKQRGPGELEISVRGGKPRLRVVKR